MHEPFRRLAHTALVGGLLVALLPIAAVASDDGPGRLPLCGDGAVTPNDDGTVVSPWQVELDDDGAVVGHRLTLRHRGQETSLRTGRRGFTVPRGDHHLLVGERDDAGTRLTMIDLRRACRSWERRIDRLAYPRQVDGEDRPLRLAVHDPGSRRFEGILLLDAESGDSGGLIDDQCIEGCTPNDGGLTPAALEPAGRPQPVPSFTAGGWPKDKTLRYRWRAGGVPPTWASGPLRSAAEDVRRTSRARSPRFVYRSRASNMVTYSGTFPAYCGVNGIACAARRLPTYWGVWLRPHGTDYAWGTLRWCQKHSANGCFDIRRVMLHELGHVVGLNHPSSAGFTLSGTDSVMQGITPGKPAPGSTRHAFGRCDVATLQELYDVPDHETRISTCNDVASTLHLTASKPTVTRGSAVALTAVLRVADQGIYRQLRRNPLDGRSVKLKYRRAGSGDPWSTAWMRSLGSYGRYRLTITPGATWEFKAVFPAPQDEGLRYSRSPLVKVKVLG